MLENTNPNKQSLIHDVMPRYFKCRFFKGQILNERILEAKDENDIKKVFSKRFPKRNLLEAIDITKPSFFYRIVFKDEKDKPAYTVRKAESEPLAIQDFIRLNPKTKIYRVDFLNEA